MNMFLGLVFILFLSLAALAYTCLLATHDTLAVLPAVVCLMMVAITWQRLTIAYQALPPEVKRS